MKAEKIFKNAFFKMVEAENELDVIDQAWENDPENEEIEAAWDAKYNDVFNATEDVVSCIYEITSGMIDKKTARAMLMKKREELVSLLSKVA